MSAARDLAPLPPVLTDADWGVDFEFYGADASVPLDYDGSSFSLVLAKSGQAKPASIIELTSGAGRIAVDAHLVSVTVPQSVLAAWPVGLHSVELRRTEGSVTEALYLGSVFIARGLSQLASLGGGAPLPADGSSAVQVFRSADALRVIRGEAAGQALAARNAAAATAADRVQTGLDRVATGADRTQTGADRVQTGLDRTQTGADRTQTGADRTQTGADRTAVAADKTDAQTARDAAIAAAAQAASTVVFLPYEFTTSLMEVGGVPILSRIIGAADVGKLLVFTAATNVVVYFDADAAIPEGAMGGLFMAGAGDVLAWPGTVPVNGAADKVRVATRWRFAVWRKLPGSLGFVIHDADAVAPASPVIDRAFLDQEAASGLLSLLIV